MKVLDSTNHQRQPRRRLAGFGVCLGAFLWVSGINAGADWISDGGSLNVVPGLHAFGPAVAVDSQDRVYATWGENDLAAEWHIFVKRLEAGVWQQVGGDLAMNPGQVSFDPCIALCGQTPYVTWVEFSGGQRQIYVKYYNGSAWVQVGGSLNVNSAESAGPHPFIAAVGLTPYVIWSENSGGVFVKHWDGAQWVQDGSQLNNHAGQYPWLAADGSTPYAAWIEDMGTTSNRAYVSHWNGSAWVADGPAVNEDMVGYPMFFGPSVTVDQGIPYVAWDQDCLNGGAYHQIYVRRWHEGAWVPVGLSLNLDSAANAMAPVIGIASGELWVTWYENYRVYVKQYTNAHWTVRGATLNVDPGLFGVVPRLAFLQGTPYVVWQEEPDLNGIYAKHWDPLAGSAERNPGELTVVITGQGRGTLNPSLNETARIYYTGSGAGEYRCQVVTLAGEGVWASRQQSMGDGVFEWAPRQAAAGVYVVMVQGPGIQAQKKVVVLR